MYGSLLGAGFENTELPNIALVFFMIYIYPLLALASTTFNRHEILEPHIIVNHFM
jgi:hypothetical protein